MDELDINQTIAVIGYDLGRTPVSLAVQTLQISKLDVNSAFSSPYRALPPTSEKKLPAPESR